jgi:hypothetical protein
VFTNSTPFLYPLIGSWGTLAFPKPWEQFIHWFRQIKVWPQSFRPVPLSQGMQTSSSHIPPAQTADPSFQPFIDKTLPSKWMIKKPVQVTLYITIYNNKIYILYEN